jgi:hypothetical protein
MQSRGLNDLVLDRSSIPADPLIPAKAGIKEMKKLSPRLRGDERKSYGHLY